MFTGFTDETIQFFLDLKFHNNAEFFHNNHERYLETVQSPFYEFINDLSADMLGIDPSMEVRPYKCLSHIHRDTRFSRDKSPYRDHLWLLFRHAGEPRDKSLFYFFELGPDRLDWGMGFWGENREVMAIFRKHIQANPAGIQALIDGIDMRGRRLMLGGSVHKRIHVPPEIPDRLRRWYCAKEMYIGKADPDYRSVFSDRILKTVRRDFLCLAPLYRLLRGFCDETGLPETNE